MREEPLTHQIYRHITKCFYEFSHQELKVMESCYMYLSRDLKLSYIPYFETMIKYKNQTSSPDYHAETRDIFRVKNFTYDKQKLDIIYQHDKSCLVLNFKQINKILRIYGISHYNYQTIFRLKELLFSSRNVKSVRVEFPPLTAEGLRQLEGAESKPGELEKDFRELTHKANQSLKKKSRFLSTAETEGVFALDQ